MKQQLFGCAFDAVDLDGAVARVADYLAGDELRQGCGVNVDHLVKMDRDRRFADAVEPVVILDLGHQLGTVEIAGADLEIDVAAGTIDAFQLLRGAYSGRYGGMQTWAQKWRTDIHVLSDSIPSLHPVL